MYASSKWFVVGSLVLVLMLLASSRPALARHDLPPLDSESVVRAPDRPLPLNHFYCYRILTSKPVSETIKTQDQFNKRLRKTKVAETTRLCNPVKKTHNNKDFPILFPNDHLLTYNIGTHTGDPKRLVEVRNQFGIQQLQVFFPAEALMVPTQKKPHDPPKDTDHFKCYFVQGQPVQTTTVELEDQFQKTEVAVVQPIWLCNPTRKLHNDKLTEILHSEAHLVCYFVTPRDFTKKVVTLNQFRREKITTTVADLLCAPSKKKILQ